MNLPSTFPKLTTSPTLFIYYGAVLLPYLSVGIGLYLFNSAWFAIGGYHLGMIILLGLIRWPIRRPNFQWSVLVQLLVGVTFFCSLLAGVLISELWPWLVKFSNNYFEVSLSAWGLPAHRWSFFVWYFCLVNPWLEEVYWRGWLGNLSDRTWETAGWFAGYHGLVLIPLIQWWWIVLVVVILTVTGRWWYQLIKFGSGLSGPVICHITAEVSIMLALNKIYILSST